MIREFFVAVWPWIAIGLIVALVLSVTVSKGKDRVAMGTRKAVSFYLASVIAYITSLVMMACEGGMGTNSVVWSSIGSMMLCLGGAQTFKNKRNQK